MRITRTDIEGRPGHYATLSRKTGSDQIEVSILTPALERTHHVQADCLDDQWSMAQCLHHHLEGTPGTNSDVNAYHRELARLAD